MKTPNQIKKSMVCCTGASCDGCEYADKRYECSELLMIDALALIQRLETQVPKWIPVTERLPEIAEHRGKYDISVRVLCSCLQKSGRRIVKEGYFEIFEGKSINWIIPGTIHRVTHWMPLPSAPEEASE